jgi:glycosyltransferase involved in cell wall biosynthesis
MGEYDVVITSSNAYFAKAIQVRKNDSAGRPDAIQICYCHTPARSLYGYSAMSDWESKPLINFFGKLINHYLRVVDVKIAQKVEYFLANSQEVRCRIEKFYRRDATIIYPPVKVPKTWAEVKKLRDQARKKYPQEYYIYVNRLAFAKHPEIAVQAASQLNFPLKVIGDGKMLPSLKALAGPTVEFLGAVRDDQLYELYAGAKALIYPVEDEDFGIVPIEAMSYGVPVIAHRSGGPKETILAGKTGLFFDELSISGLVAAIHALNKIKFDPQKIYAHAQQFSEEEFAKKIVEFITEKLA